LGAGLINPWPGRLRAERRLRTHAREPARRPAAARHGEWRQNPASALCT